MLTMMYGSPDGVRYCQHCERVTPMVLDHATGETICTDCVFVLGNAHSDLPWRAASPKDGAADDSDDGVGGGLASPADPLLPGCEVVAPPKLRMPKMRGSVPDTNKALVEGFDAIADMAARLGLADTVTVRAKELLRKLEEAKACRTTRGRSRDGIYAACLHTACRMEGSPRTLRELISATSDAAAAKRGMGKFINAIKRHLGKEEEEDQAGQQDQAAEDMKRSGGGGVMARAGDYLRRYRLAVGMSDQEMNAARRAASTLVEDESIDVRRNPQSIAAAIVYMALQRSGGGRGRQTVRDVSAATGVSATTIHLAHKELCPYAALLFG